MLGRSAPLCPGLWVASLLLDDAKRQVIVEAGLTWMRYVKGDFPEVTVGERLNSTANPFGEITLTEPIDDLVIFIGSAPLGLGINGRLMQAIGNPLDPAKNSKSEIALNARMSKEPYQPFTGTITYDNSVNFFADPTPSTNTDIPKDQVDLFFLTLHEIGHILAFPPSSRHVFKKYVSNNMEFIGTTAMKVYDDRPVPLYDGSHFAENNNPWEGPDHGL